MNTNNEKKNEKNEEKKTEQNLEKPSKEKMKFIPFGKNVLVELKKKESAIVIQLAGGAEANSPDKIHIEKCIVVRAGDEVKKVRVGDEIPMPFRIIKDPSCYIDLSREGKDKKDLFYLIEEDDITGAFKSSL